MPLLAAEKKFFDQLAAAAGAQPSLDSVSLQGLRESTAGLISLSGPEAVVPKEDQCIPVRDGSEISVRIYHSNLKKAPAFIFYPACAYSFPFFELNAVACSRIAHHAGCKVIVVNHRLAPEHAMPGPILDAYDATVYLYQHAEEFGIDREYFCVGGFSSGAGCAALVSLMGAKKKTFKVHHQILLNGYADLSRSLRNEKFASFEDQDLFCNQAMQHRLPSLIQLSQDVLQSSDYSPYYDEQLYLSPRTTFLIGEYDGLRSDSEAFYKKICDVGVSAERILLEGQSHNTFIFRAALCDGLDPAQVIAQVLLNQLPSIW